MKNTKKSTRKVAAPAETENVTLPEELKLLNDMLDEDSKRWFLERYRFYQTNLATDYPQRSMKGSYMGLLQLALGGARAHRKPAVMLIDKAIQKAKTVEEKVPYEHGLVAYGYQLLFGE